MDDTEREASGTLYRLDADLGWTAVDGGYEVTNGPAFSPDGRIMYHNDSALQVTYAFDLDEAGKPSTAAIFMPFGPGDGYPDGMTVDAEGCLWIAFWDGWCRAALLARGRLAPDCRSAGAAADQLRLRRRDWRPLYITSAHRHRRKRSSTCNQMPGGCSWLTPACADSPTLPFAG